MSQPNKDNIRLWAEALESGEYEQGDGHLRYTHKGKERFCCLGVACEAAIKAGLELPYVPARPPVAARYGTERAEAILPGEVMDWLGVDSSNPVLTNADGESNDAYVWNDGLDATFTEIAAMIRHTFLDGE